MEDRKKFSVCVPVKCAKSAYIISLHEVIKDETGAIVELHCQYDPDSKSGGATAGRKVKGTLHWVSAAHAVPAEVRLYEHLFTRENPDEDEEGKSFVDYLNPDSMQILTSCMVEPSGADLQGESRYQFLRQGYFVWIGQ